MDTAATEAVIAAAAVLVIGGAAAFGAWVEGQLRDHVSAALDDEHQEQRGPALVLVEGGKPTTPEWIDAQPSPIREALSGLYYSQLAAVREHVERQRRNEGDAA